MSKKKKKVSHDHMTKKDFQVGDTVAFCAEVQGIFPGSTARVDAIQFGGAVFFVTVLTGLKDGTEIRVKADDIR